MIDRTFLEKIEEMSRTEIVDLHGIKFSTKKLNHVIKPQPDTIDAYSLKAIVDYMDMAEVPKEDLFIHIESPASVILYKKMENFEKTRERLIHVRLPDFGFVFGRFYELEHFIIHIQVNFIATETRDTVLRILGNIADQNITTRTDDGVTQSVQAKTGIVKVNHVDLPNPITLVPFRSFPEIYQPASLFVLRGKKNNNVTEWALFEADGGAWKLEAVDNISTFLKSTISIPVIA